MNTRYPYLFTILLVAIALCGCEQEQYGQNTVLPLQFNIDKDSSFHYLIKSHVALTPQMDDGKEVTIDQDMTIASTFSLVSKQQNRTELSVTYNRLILSSGGDAINTEFDTDNDDGSITIYQGIRDMIDKPFAMTVSANGAISEQGFIEHGDRTISDSSFRKVLTQALHIYPNHPVKVGETWQKQFKTSIGFLTINVTNNYKLMFLNGPVAHIEVSSRIASDSNTQMGNAKMSIMGIQSGSLDVQISSGLITNGRFEQQLSGTIDFAGKETPVSITSNIDIMGSKKKNPSTTK